jgi:hypothetical protein
MGDVSDIGELLGKALQEKRTRLLWSLLTAIGTAIVTTFGVGWAMRGHVDRLESELAQQGRDISDLKEALKVVPTMQRELQEARAQADKAMLYAQLTKREKP